MQSILLHAPLLPWPVNWDEVYGRTAPILVEIGFGSGHFLIDWARQRPDANVLGLEISLPSLRKGESKIRNTGLTNVRVVQGGAPLVLQALFAPASLSEVFINFPDPWRKERHYHRRLISDEFLNLLATRLSPGGLLDIATDHPDYAPWITERLERTPYFASRLPTTFVTEDNERLRTKYELIALEEGRTCHYFKWRRNAETAVNPFPIPEELPMPHIIMSSPLSLAEIGQRFEPQHTSDGETHVKLLEMYQSFYDQKLLVETYVREEPLTQRVGLSVFRRQTGELVVGLHDVGFPRPTRGIQLAIAHLAQWILGLHPDSTVIANNLSNAIWET
ncbi:MAG: tRNA (guanosine(46)-N7)-methyltransferase TrmB [Ardenticatenaceae bacterium]|nr:tRNA (guanosine(46)-N7)-methyltransferase TrmB [Ardenticatenaceae bacterium]